MTLPNPMRIDDPSPRPGVVLVGPTRQENLALQYLAAAAEVAGFSAEIASFDSREDAAQVVEIVLRHQPRVVGLGLSFQHFVQDYLELAELLREKGYRGHITAGGHVPTFSYAALLGHCDALSSCVRHDGEQTLVELLQRLESSKSLDGLAGLVWREGRDVKVSPRRASPECLDSLAPPRRAKEPYLVAGLPIAFLIAARGCIGECAYCSISAFARTSGSARYRLRSPEAVGQEIATLSRQGVILSFVQDDLFVLPDEQAAVRRMRALREVLDREGVGRMGFWIKSRPESITPKVIEAARDLGAIHVFLGIESAVEARLRYLGRRHSPAQAQSALRICREAGVHPSFNLMLFDPESTLEEIGTTIDFAAQHLDLPWNLCRTEIYPGTELFHRLESAGRLLGDFRAYGYVMSDRRAELMFRILRICLHDRAFAADSLLNRLISLNFAVQAHQWRFPGVESDALANEVMVLSKAAHQDTVDILRRVLDFSATAPEDSPAARQLGIQEGMTAGVREAPWQERASWLWEHLHARGRMLHAKSAS